MSISLRKNFGNLVYKLSVLIIVFAFMSANVILPAKVYAQSIFTLPQVGTMVSVTPGFYPAVIKGIQTFPENPLRFKFIIDTGDSQIKDEELKEESEKLIKYFLASLTTPEEDMWVNLSPYENNRIIPENFGHTEMGRDLLAQDYMLKQLTASLMYPEDELGEEFWGRVYKIAYERYGITDIPMDTFNKVWIVPDKAVLFEDQGMVFVLESNLKVMLESDYLAFRSSFEDAEMSDLLGVEEERAENPKQLEEIKEVIKEVLIPEIEREVNQGKTFIKLRQMYNSMILAAWYKSALKQSLVGQIYVDKNKVKGIDLEDKEVSKKIYRQYVEAFKQGVFNYIKEDYDPISQEIIPRKYFSGGFISKNQFGETLPEIIEKIEGPIAALGSERREYVERKLGDNSMFSDKIEVDVNLLEATPKNEKYSAQNPVSFATLGSEVKLEDLQGKGRPVLVAYQEKLLKAAEIASNRRPENYSQPVVAHINSHRALIRSLRESNVISDEMASFGELFAETHDLGYSMDILDPAFKSKFIGLWVKIGVEILGLSEEEAFERASDIYAFMVANKGNPLVEKVIMHGTLSMIATIERLEASGFESDEALGLALIIAAHHPGNPIDFVASVVLPNIGINIPNNLLPVLFITDINSSGEITNPDDLRIKIRDYVVKLLDISKTEASQLISFGYALDRITPARRMVDFRVEGDSVEYSDGETFKKYALATTNFTDPAEPFTLRRIFERTIDFVKGEANYAIETSRKMAEGLGAEGQEIVKNTEDVVKLQSSYEIGRTEDIHRRVLELSEGIDLVEAKGFSGELRNLSSDIEVVRTVYEGMSVDDSQYEEAGYLLATLIKLKEEAQGNIDKHLIKIDEYLAQRTSEDPVGIESAVLLSNERANIGEGEIKDEKGTENVGGIDFNSDMLDLQIKRNSAGIPLPLAEQPIYDLNIEGFVPVIINVTPVSNILMLLGNNRKELIRKSV
ncbi:MAG: hypothetical protein KKD07_00125 [Candidatus Omnitrophica bacterium]|nr:hypothetical protein [Candidatus Omnitrophota bacterium]